MKLMDIYSSADKNTKAYLKLEDAISDGLNMSKNISNSLNIGPITDPSEIRRQYESWQRNCSIYLKSIKIKDDFGFSVYVNTENKLDYEIGKIKFFLTDNDKSFLKEIKNFINEKVNILESIKNSLVVSKTKLFDYIDGQYYLDGIPVNPNKKTLSYILFDSSYKIQPEGGEILYLQLKKYLIGNKISYKNKNNKKITFWEDNSKTIKNKMQNNLCGGKGILRLKKIHDYLYKNNIADVFICQKGTNSYIFNNKK